MTVGQHLEFSCIECKKPVAFSVIDLTEITRCRGCGRCYTFDQETLLDHLRKFEALCRQLHASQDILSQAAVAVDVGQAQVQIPFSLLLTRLNSVITLEIDGQRTEIRFRVDPSQELTEASA